MKRLFLQLWQNRNDRTGEMRSYLFTGLHFVWDEAQPVWMELRHGCWDTIPDADEIYIAAGSYMTLTKMWEWAKRAPNQKFIIGGPMVQTMHLCPIEKLPSNYILTTMMAEELFDKPQDPRSYKIVPPETGNPLSYIYPHKRACSWGRCRYCIEPTQELRHCSLKPLSTALPGEVYVSGPSMGPSDYYELEDVDLSEKQIYISSRAEEKNLEALRYLAKHQDTKQITLRVGVEFPTDRMLSIMGKGISKNQYVRFLLEAHELGYGIGLSFIHDGDV